MNYFFFKMKCIPDFSKLVFSHYYCNMFSMRIIYNLIVLKCNGSVNALDVRN